MISDERFGGTVSVWLQGRAGSGKPDYLDDILGRTSGTRQRPGWSTIERWPPMEIGLTRVVQPSRFQPRSVLKLAITALLIGAVVAAIAFAASQRRVPPPFGPAANGVILSQDGRGDIFVSAADGTGSRPLIVGAAEDVQPWFTHDGTRFMFWRRASLNTWLPMLADADGSRVRPLVDAPFLDPMWMEFSPIDDQVAIVHRVDDRRVVSILDVASGVLRQLDVPGLDVDNDVLWLPPDGNELIFTARPKSSDPSGAGLYGIRPDGTGFREILPASAGTSSYFGLEIAHDGRRLAYWQVEADEAGEMGARVHVVDLATGADERMMFDAGNAHEAGLHFSPDGTTGAMAASDGTATFIQLVDLAGSAPPRRVGPSFAGDALEALAFSPDGKQALFVVNDEPY